MSFHLGIERHSNGWLGTLSRASKQGVPHEDIWFGDFSEKLVGIMDGGWQRNCRGVDEFSESMGVRVKAIDYHQGVDLLQGSEVRAISP